MLDSLGAEHRCPGHADVLTSISAQRAHPGLSLYAAAKAGLEAACRSLARELRGRALVNCVAPGFFLSAMSAPLGGTEIQAVTWRTPQVISPIPVESCRLSGFSCWSASTSTVKRFPSTVGAAHDICRSPAAGRSAVHPCP
ncbi:SDR family oxidoreductase [Lentzea atacamensis]|uniref:SDR family oxidoreductase n=1 Tax=Lentzea atacamensis TaxID=531938 RepID=UPI00389923CA